MPIKLFIRRLFEEKKGIIVTCVIGFVVFSLVGYIQSQINSVNEGIVYCSEASILVEEESTDQYMILNGTNTQSKRNKAIVLSDEVINEVREQLKVKAIELPFEEIKKGIAVNAVDSVISIIVYNTDSEASEIICDAVVHAAKTKLEEHIDGNIIILNEASAPFSACIELVDNGTAEQTFLVTRKDFTQITSLYIVKQIFKFGILGVLLGFFVSMLMLSVKILFKEEE